MAEISADGHDLPGEFAALQLEVDIALAARGLAVLRMARGDRLMRAHRRGRCLRYGDISRAIEAYELAHQAVGIAIDALRRVGRTAGELKADDSAVWGPIEMAVWTELEAEARA